MRMYIQPSWNNAAEDWSGDGPDNRRCKSTEMYLPNGKANTAAFADVEKKKKPRSIIDKVDLAGAHLNRMELMSAELESDFDNGRITLEEYSRGRRIMDERLKKAWDRVAKQEGWQDEPTEEQSKVNNYSWSAPTVADKKDSIFLSLPIDNSFRRAYTWLQKAKNLFKGA